MGDLKDIVCLNLTDPNERMCHFNCTFLHPTTHEAIGPFELGGAVLVQVPQYRAPMEMAEKAFTPKAAVAEPPYRSHMVTDRSKEIGYWPMPPMEEVKRFTPPSRRG